MSLIQIPSRREFLRSSLGAAPALTAAITASNYRALAAPKGPNDQIVMGFIGVGGQGTSRLREFMKQPDVRVAHAK